jgi:hypothetical protein
MDRLLKEALISVCRIRAKPFMVASYEHGDRRENCLKCRKEGPTTSNMECDDRLPDTFRCFPSDQFLDRTPLTAWLRPRYRQPRWLREQTAYNLWVYSHYIRRTNPWRLRRKQTPTLWILTPYSHGWLSEKAPLSLLERYEHLAYILEDVLTYSSD